MEKQTIEDFKVRNKRVIVRVDFNVPMDDKGRITDDTRIVSTLPTIHNLLGRGAKIILISHLGRPKGVDPTLTLKPVAKRLASLLEMTEIPVIDVLNPGLPKKISAMKPGSIIMLENIRFYDGERKDFMKFAKYLASLGDLYVNDAFGVCHRAHASTVGIPTYLPSAAGLLLEDEIRFLHMFLSKPARPIVVVIGGKKASTKIAVIDKFLEKADTVMVGGGVANTFLRSWGFSIGKSVNETEMLETTKRLIWKASQVNTAMLMPDDVVVAASLDAGAKSKVVTVDKVPDSWYIVDIGPKTIQTYTEHLSKAGTIIWSGPMGVFENPKFAKGTHAILEAAVKSGANTLTGGGDTIAAMKGTPWYNKISHISTGGGAMLEFIEKGTLPGIEALSNK